MRTAAILFVFLFVVSAFVPLLLFIPSPIQAATLAPNYKPFYSCLNNKATCLDIAAPPIFFNGSPNPNQTAHYVFTNLGIDFWFNSNGNFSIPILKAQWGSLSSPCLLVPNGNPVVVNASTVSQSFRQSFLCGSNTMSMTVYYKQQISGGYVSLNMKQAIVYSFSSYPATLSEVFLNPNNGQRSTTSTRVTFGKAGYDWSDSPSATFNASTNTLSWSLASSGTIDPTTIATSTNANPVAFSFQLKTCQIGSRYVAADTDGTNLIQKSATDKAFTTGIVTNTIRAVAQGKLFGTWCDTTNSKWGYAYTPADGGSNLFVRTYVFNADGTLSADGPEMDLGPQIPANDRHNTAYPSIYFSGANEGWVAVGDRDTIVTNNNFVDVLYCATSCGGGATNWNSVKSYNTGQGTDTWGGIIVPLSTAAKKALILGVDNGGTRLALQLQTTSNSGTTWSTPQATTSSFLLDGCSATSISDTTHVACTFTSTVYFSFGLSPGSAPSENTLDSTGNFAQGEGIASDGSSKLVVVFCTATSVFTMQSSNSGATWAAKVTQTSSESSLVNCNVSFTLNGGTDLQALWSAGSISPFNVRFLDITVTWTITLTEKCTTSPAGATQDTGLAFSGAAYVSGGSTTCNGATSSMTVNPSQQLIVTVGTAGANQLYRFNQAGTLASTITITTPASAGNWFFTEYLTDTTTASYSGTLIAGCTATLHFTQGGNATTYQLTSSGTSKSIDDGTSWTVAKATACFTATHRSESNTANSTASAGLSIAPVFYEQWLATYQYTVNGGGSPTVTNIVSTTQFGATVKLTPSLAGQTGWTDTGTTSTYAHPIAGATGEQWDANSGASASITSAASMNPTYYHQYLITDSGLSYTYTQFGAAQSATTANQFVDSGTSMSVTADGYTQAWTISAASWVYEMSTQGFVGIQLLGDQAISAITGVISTPSTPYLTFTTVSSSHVKGFIPSPLKYSVTYVKNNGVNNAAFTFVSNVLDETGLSPHEWDFSTAQAPGGGAVTPPSPPSTTGGGGGAVFIPPPPAPTVAPPVASVPVPENTVGVGILGLLALIGGAVAIQQYRQSHRIWRLPKVGASDWSLPRSGSSSWQRPARNAERFWDRVWVRPR